MSSEFESLRQAKKYHAPLNDGDTAERTVGCRHTAPDICKNNGLSGVCAFVSEDGLCHQPPISWPKQYIKLGEAGFDA